MERRLFRSQQNRIFMGVCGGLGEYFNVDPVIIRVITVLLILFTWIVPGIIAYLVMALVIPLQGAAPGKPEDVLHENVAEIKDATVRIGENIRSTFEAKDTPSGPTGKGPGSTPPGSPSRLSNSGLYIIGIIIVAIGVFFLLVNFISWFWVKLWPLWLVAAGVVIIILVAVRKK
jgi:phage shock protein C